MNHSDNFYVKMGTLLCTYAAMASVTVTLKKIYKKILENIYARW